MLVTYNRLSVHNANGVTLKPGVNSVPAALWLAAKLHPMVQYDIDEGFIVEEQEPAEMALLTPGEEAEVETNVLEAMRQPQAKALVESTIDLGLLERWHKTEKRTQVIGAIRRQIEALTAPAEERDRDQQRQITTGAGPIETFVRNPEDPEYVS